MYNDGLEPTAADLARWIKARRLAEMLTQEQLAERAGLSVRTVRYLEAGEHPAPRPHTRRLVIAALSRVSTVAAEGTPVPAQLPANHAGPRDATEHHELEDGPADQEERRSAEDHSTQARSDARHSCLGRGRRPLVELKPDGTDHGPVRQEHVV